MSNKLNLAVIIALLAAFLPVADARAEAVFVERTGSANPFDGVDIGSNSAPTFVDLDADGDMDAFVGERDGFLNYYENTGNSASPTLTVRSGSSNPLDVDVGWYSTPAFVDIDADGDMDAFIGRSDGRISFYENTGDATNPTFTHRTGVDNPLDHINVVEESAPAFVDRNGDGDMDVFIGSSSDDWANHLYLSDNGILWNSESVIDPNFQPQAVYITRSNADRISPAFADIDMDGDYDLFWGQGTGSVYFFENTGTANGETFEMNADNPLSGLGLYENDAKPTFVDIDGDGDMDVFVGFFAGTIKFFENTGDNTKKGFYFYERAGSGLGNNPLYGEDVGTYSTPTFFDVKADGDMDGIVGEGDGIFNFFENISNATQPDFDYCNTVSCNPLYGEDVGSWSIPAFVDIDRDGDMDAFSGEGFGTIFFFENTGQAVTSTLTLTSGTANPFNIVDVGSFSAPAFVDINTDGAMDAFVGELGGSVRFFNNIGSAINPSFIERTGSMNPFNGIDVGTHSKPSFIDIDVDGDMDAFIGEYEGNINYFENTGSILFPTFVERTGAQNPFNGIDVGTYSAPSFVDVDADGWFEAFLGSFEGTIRFFESKMPKIFLPLMVR